MKKEIFYTEEAKKIEAFFKEKKGITIDAAFKHGAKYSAIDMGRFAIAYAKEVKQEQPTDEEIKKCFVTLSLTNLNEENKDFLIRSFTMNIKKLFNR